MYILYIPSDPSPPSVGGFLPPFPPVGRRGLIRLISFRLICSNPSISSKRELQRRERDSNPRNPYEFNGFRDRPIQPLSHLSNKPEAERIRTSDLQIRNLKLYPAELQPHFVTEGLTICPLCRNGCTPHYSEQGGFGLQPRTSCTGLPTRLRLLPAASCCLFLPLVGEGFSSHPHEGGF